MPELNGQYHPTWGAAVLDDLFRNYRRDVERLGVTNATYQEDRMRDVTEFRFRFGQAYSLVVSCTRHMLMDTAAAGDPRNTSRYLLRCIEDQLRHEGLLGFRDPNAINFRAAGAPIRYAEDEDAAFTEGMIRAMREQPINVEGLAPEVPGYTTLEDLATEHLID